MSPQTHTNWILIFALFVTGLLGAAQFGKLTLTLEAMRETYAHRHSLIPTLISIAGIVGLIFGVVAGDYVVRFGTARVLIWAMLIGGAMSFIQAFLPVFLVFSITRVIEGFSHLVIVVACPTLIASASSDADRPFAMGIWASFFGFSFALLAIILPLLLSTGGLPLLFVGHGLGFLALAFVMKRLLPDTPQVSQVSQALPSITNAYRDIYTNVRLLIPGASFIWYTALYIALIAVLPLALDLPAHVVSGLPLISIAGTVGAGYVAKFVPPARLVVAGFVATALLMGVVWGGDAPLFVLFVMFFVMGAIPAGSFASIPHFNDTLTDRARATGGVAHFGNIGTTLGMPIMVFLFDFFGITGVVMMSIICCVSGIMISVILGRKIG
ncbi:MAG: MFS transporter [Litoreibacter sp.]